MNTAKGVGNYVLKTPSALVAATATSLTTGAFFAAIRKSETILDDSVLVLMFFAAALVLYFQFDPVVTLAERVQPQVKWKIETDSKCAALTIDDVPLLIQPTVLESILAVLKKHKVRATFFIMSGFDLSPSEGGMDPGKSSKIRRLLQQAVLDGHELANHLQFDKPAIAMPKKEFDAAFEHCDKLIADIYNGEKLWRSRPHRWFRPGSALWNQHMLDVAAQHGYTTALSNCHPFDVSSVTRFFNATYLAFRVRPGAIIVLHDRWHTPHTLDKAIPKIKQKGIELCTLSELQAVATVGSTRTAE